MVGRTHSINDLEESEIGVAALLEQVTAVRLRKSRLKVREVLRHALLPESLGSCDSGFLLLLVVLANRDRMVRVMYL